MTSYEGRTCRTPTSTTTPQYYTPVPTTSPQYYTPAPIPSQQHHVPFVQQEQNLISHNNTETAESLLSNFIETFE